MSRTVGIDLGTTNSLVAIVEQGRPRVLTRGEERLVPSVVGLSDDGRIVVGQTALNQYVLAPERTVRSIKRKMGGAERVELGDREYSPEEISALILRHLKTLAEEVLGDTVDAAVITVPAYFNDAQRQATKRAGELAGLEVPRIINEPTAAALAYGIEKQLHQFLMVYDLGGGTFVVSIIEQQGDVLEVRASHGNVHLGGDDFDERVLQHLIAHLSGEPRYDFKADRRAMARLVRASERAKIALSSAPYARAAEEFLARYDGQIAHLNAELGQRQFEEMIDDLLRSTLDSNPARVGIDRRAHRLAARDGDQSRRGGRARSGGPGRDHPRRAGQRDANRRGAAQPWRRHRRDRLQSTDSGRVSPDHPPQHDHSDDQGRIGLHHIAAPGHGRDRGLSGRKPRRQREHSSDQFQTYRDSARAQSRRTARGDRRIQLQPQRHSRGDCA